MYADGVLKDKVVVVTGGGSGLGRAMALRCAELGAKLVLAGRRQEKLDEVAGEISAAGGEALGISTDIRDYDAVTGMVQQAVERFGKVDCLVNNAAGNFICPTEELTPNGFNAIVSIVLNGTFHVTHAVGKHMIERGEGGSILSLTAVYAPAGSAFVVPSACAKSGVLALTRSLAVEWGRHKIRLNTIAPGPFPTKGAWSRLVPPGMDEELFKRKIPLRRYGEHSELANLAVYLLSDHSGYVTGQQFAIDGGESVNMGMFNALTELPHEVLAAGMRAMRPKK